MTDTSRRDRKIEERRNRLREKAKTRAEAGGRAEGSGDPAEIPDIAPRHSRASDTASDSAGHAARRVRTSSGGSATRSARHARASASADGSAAGTEKKRRKFFNWKFKLVLALLLIAVITFGGLRLKEYIEGLTDILITDEGFTHAERFSKCVPLNGIDVSAYQGDEIRWKKVKTSGTDFAFIRAGYRSADKGTLNTDKQFEANMEGAIKAGIMTGAYFYSQALTPAEAEEEAEYLLELVKPYDISLPLVIDFEIYPDGRLAKKIDEGNMAAASIYHDIVLAFCRKVEAAGYESAVYANYDMLTHYMQADLLDKSATIWLAQYGETSDLEADYWFWQATDQGRVGGINGSVDHDFWYIEPGRVYKTRAAGIKKEKKRVSIGGCEVTFSKDSYKVSMHKAVPKAKVTYKGRGLKKGRDYEISAVKNTGSGTGYVIIRGKRKYKDWIMVPFKIE